MPCVPKSPESARAIYASVKREKPDTIVFVRRDDGPGICTFDDDARHVAEVLGLPRVHGSTSDSAGYDARHQTAWIAEMFDADDSPVARLQRRRYHVAVIHGVPGNQRSGGISAPPQP